MQSHVHSGVVCGSATAGSSPMEEARCRSHWRGRKKDRGPKLRGKRCHKSHHGLWKCCLSQGPKWRKVRLRCHELGSKVITAHGGNAGAKFTSRWEAISRGKGHNGKENTRIMHYATTRTSVHTRARADTSTHEVSPPNVTAVTTILYNRPETAPPGPTARSSPVTTEGTPNRRLSRSKQLHEGEIHRARNGLGQQVSDHDSTRHVAESNDIARNEIA